MGLSPKAKRVYLPEAAYFGEDAINEMILLAIDPGRMIGVVEKTSTPPGSPTNGNVWIVGAGATGDWAGQAEDTLAFRIDDAWIFKTPYEGLAVFDGDGPTVADSNFLIWVDTGDDPPGPGWKPVKPKFLTGNSYPIAAKRDGSPVFSFSKAIASLPNNTTVSFPHGFIGLDVSKVVEIGGYAKDGSNVTHSLPMAITTSGWIHVQVDANQIHVTSNFNASAWSAEIYMTGYLEVGSFVGAEYFGVMRSGASSVFRRFDPVVNSWDTGANITSVDDDGTAWRSTNGSTYVGGNNNSGALKSYASGTDSWTTRNTRPVVSVDAPCAADGEGDGYFFSAGTGDDDSHFYDVSGSSWSAILDSVEACNRGLAGDGDNILYKGLGNGAGGLRRYSVSGDAYFAEAAAHPDGDNLHDMAYFLISGYVHTVGGSIGAGNAPQDDHDSYDNSGDVWTARAAFNQGDVKACGGGVDPTLERAFVALGENSSATKETWASTYSRATDSWVSLLDAPAAALGDVHGQFASISK